MSGPRYIQSPAALSDPSLLDQGAPVLGAPVPFIAADFEEVKEGEQGNFRAPASSQVLVPSVEVGAVVKRTYQQEPMSIEEADRIHKQEVKRLQDEALKASGQLTIDLD